MIGVDWVANNSAEPSAARDANGSPRAHYVARLAESRSIQARQERRASALAHARFATFLVLLAVAWAAWISHVISSWWIIPPLILFVILVIAFDRAEKLQNRAGRLVAYQEQGLLRVDDLWMGRGNAGLRFIDPEHPYASDLDLFGQGSLFERISTVQTHSGEETLAAWLLNPASPEVIVQRQTAVADLCPRSSLREDLAVLGVDLGANAVFEGLADWGSAPVRLRGIGHRLVALALAIAGFAALIGWLGLGWPWVPFVAIACAEGIFATFHFRNVKHVLSHVERRTHELEMLAGMLARLEVEPFEAPLLRTLQARLIVVGKPASALIEQMRRLLATLDTRRNLLIAPISPILLWGTQSAFAIEAWRARSGPSIAGWLATLAEFEALLSIATFAFENPADAFPTIDTGDGPNFVADGLGHSLLPIDRVVRNDVALGGPEHPDLLIVSGSNMSGKSTLLRAVGVAAVLAQAGGTVRAARLSLSPLAIGATLRVQDSLQAGRSRFYAEVLRLRRILELSRGPLRLLFLLDEILAGTNSHDRHAGAEAIVLGLVERSAIGLVTTHDLALAEIAGKLPGRALNVHFADHLEGQTMHFDYKVQPGVVRHSNALALMRSVGLEV